MEEKRGLSLPLAVAELVSRMTREEQEALAVRLSWEQLRTLEALKKRHEASVAGQEPYIYVSIGSDSVSFESPMEKVGQLVECIAAKLAAKAVSIRFPEKGNAPELSRPISELGTLLVEEAESLVDKPIVIEIDGSTLYSQGGGCLLLKTGASGETKRAIAEVFLQICGYPHSVQTDRFTALVHNGELEIIEP